jgi:hypothetical protein
MIAVFAFFAYLLHSVQDLAEETKKERSPTPTIATSRWGTEENATLNVISAARLSSLLSAVKRYAKDHQGQLPPMDTQKTLHASLSPAYVTAEGVFHSPQSREAYLPNPALSKKPLKSFPDPAETIAFYEPLDSAEQQREKHRAVVFLDGSQRMASPQEWDVLRKKAGIP